MATLTVIEPFGSYARGQSISDPVAIAAILASPQKIYVVTAADPSPGSGLVTPTQPNAVTPVIGAPSGALAIAFGLALDLTSVPNTLYKWTGTAWAVILQAGSGGTAPAVPVNTVLPAITGTAQVGQALACSTGTWTGSPTAFAYQWQRNGTAIVNATGAGYTPVSADIGAVLTCAVTASNAGGAAQVAVSAATSAVVAAPVVPVLQVLGLSTLSGTAGSAFSASISGTTAGSTLVATAADGTLLTIANGTVSGTFAAAGQKQIAIVETLAGATGSPKTTTLTLTIAAAAPVLQLLGLASLSAVAGTPFSTAMSGQTAGSTVAATSSDGTVLTVANGQVSGTFSAAGSPTLTLTETLAGATGSPKSTQLAMTVSAAAPAQPAGIGADLNDAMNTTFL